MMPVFAAVCRAVSHKLFIPYVSTPLYSLLLLPFPKYTLVNSINFSLFWKNGQEYHYVNHCVYVFTVVIFKSWNSSCAANLWTTQKIHVSPPKDLTVWGSKPKNFLADVCLYMLKGLQKAWWLGFESLPVFSMPVSVPAHIRLSVAQSWWQYLIFKTYQGMSIAWMSPDTMLPTHP